MTTRSCPKCSLLMARCDFKYCPDCGENLDGLCPSDAAACSASLNPKTDALRDLYENHEHRASVGDIWDLCEFLERESLHWRREHDRVVAAYQHRLTVLGASAIESTIYPENVHSEGSAPTQPTAGEKEHSNGN